MIRTPRNRKGVAHRDVNYNSPTPSTDSVEVFCRVKPPNYLQAADSCLEVLDNQTVVVTAPAHSAAGQRGLVGSIRSSFNQVLNEHCSQEEVFTTVALPLVEDLVSGRNGLLFTYGVTGSGKTHTMKGSMEEDPGILPRTLEAVFEAVGNQLTKKFVVRPDGCANGFVVQSEVDAMMERQRCETMHRILPVGPIDPVVSLGPAARSTARVSASTVAEDNLFAVFVSLVEIYNNHVFDLLEELPVDNAGRQQPPVNKQLREDPRRRMYVSGCVEVECQSADEAYQVFLKGEKRRKVAHTALNAESSRSHSVFTVRLVQGPLDRQQGDELSQKPELLIVSQLALVDLAGSERTNRTRNAGDRLKEASSINNSLLTLRKCIEQLRDNQHQQNIRNYQMVPYRESKLTHLFKNYFDGDGHVKMVVCVNTLSEEYDETVRVLQFAVMTQEVQVPRTVVPAAAVTVAPVKELKRPGKIPTASEVLARTSGGGSSAVPFYFPTWPSLELRDCQDTDTLPTLIDYLNSRIRRRQDMMAAMEQELSSFRSDVVDTSERCTSAERAAETAKSAQERAEATTSSQRVDKRSAEKRARQAENDKQSTLQELRRVQDELSRQKTDNNKLRSRLQDRDARYNELIRSMQSDLRRVPSQPQAASTDSESENMTRPGTARGRVHQRPMVAPKPPATPGRHAPGSGSHVRKMRRAFSPPGRNNAVTAPSPVNPRHRRSQSASELMWLDHHSKNETPTGTVLQPSGITKKKSVTKLEVRDVTERATNYMLTHQVTDPDSGQLQTEVYKGDVIPSAGGGAAVIFNDIETLSQRSPIERKRTSSAANNLPSDTGSTGRKRLKESNL